MTGPPSQVHRVEQALGEIQPALTNGDVQLRNEDADYVQTLSEMEKKISVGEHGRRRRHMLRKVSPRLIAMATSCYRHDQRELAI